MLVIVKACKHWKHYVESALHTIRVLMDHMNLYMYFNEKIKKSLEIRWWEKLLGLDFAIKHQKINQTWQMSFHVSSIIIKMKPNKKP